MRLAPDLNLPEDRVLKSSPFSLKVTFASANLIGYDQSLKFNGSPKKGKSMKGYVIGDEDLVLGFQLLGIRGTVVSNEKEFPEILRRIAEEKDVKIIFIGEDLSTRFQDEIDSLRSKKQDILIVEVPERGKAGGGIPTAQKLLQKILKIRV